MPDKKFATIQDLVKDILREKPNVNMTLDDVVDGQTSRGMTYSRRQIRSAVGVVCRDYSCFYRIGEATFVFSEMKLTGEAMTPGLTYMAEDGTVAIIKDQEDGTYWMSHRIKADIAQEFATTLEESSPY